ncbi:MAG: HAD family hydrolase [Thermomicrobiales bacterium]
MTRTFAGSRQVLIFDADDTLWENNILFERVIDDFMRWVSHPTLDDMAIRAMLNHIQSANAVTHGYGSRMLIHSLGECFEQLRERPATGEERRHIDTLAANLAEGKVELIPGVADTLSELGTRHELLLLTKGHPGDQQRKLDVSGLAHHFRSIHIVHEKDAQIYHDLARQLALTTASTWMIGNSPKSDINPARQAGMNAVFIPNDNTWVLEHSEIDPGDARVLRLDRFPQLLDHF